MEFIPSNSVRELVNPGVTSRQLLCPANSSSERITITEVHVRLGATQPRHTHASSEQVWYALRGTSRLLLANGEERTFLAGDVARFADGDVHGLLNDGETDFVYLSVTAPPIDFGYAYQGRVDPT